MTDAGRWSWSRAAQAAGRDLLLFAAMLVVLELGRIALILIYHRELGPHGGTGAILTCLAAGLRFDARVACFAIAPSLLVSLAQARWALGAWTGRLRLTLGAAFVGLTILLVVVDAGFYAEYHEQFDNQLLGAVYDDLDAVLKTVWAEHHVVLAVLGWLASCALATWGLSRLLGRVALPQERLAALPRVAKAALSVAVAAALVVSARGSLWGRPVQRKDIAVTGDQFLDKLVVNPWKALHYVIEDHLALRSAAGITAFLADGDARAAAKRYFAQPGDLDDLDAYCLRQAPGDAAPPRTIWLVVMESYSAWPMLPAYHSLGLSRELEDLAARGTSTLRCLSAGTGTIPSLGTLITGLQECGVQTNYQPSSRTPYPTSLPAIFDRLGYRTRFFYAGFPSWQRIGPFAHDQGFDETYGGGDMGGNFLAGKEWGVDDDVLFTFAARTAAAGSGPSLNVIMTVSNHPPYGVDVEGKGFPLKTPPEDLAARWDGTTSLHVLGHFWFSDRCLGEFVRRAEHDDPGALFAITGDHYGRRFIDAHPTMLERLAVPLVLYGPRALQGRALPPESVGCHLDILPTLIDLAAPAGFRYHALGRDLLRDPPAPGLGREAAITPHTLVEWSGPGAIDRDREPDVDPATLHQRYEDLCGISWWRIMRGNRLP
jgi:phosphoglycerol transferase MdoB-like AlkP superfamily enzyme